MKGNLIFLCNFNLYIKGKCSSRTLFHVPLSGLYYPQCLDIYCKLFKLLYDFFQIQFNHFEICLILLEIVLFDLGIHYERSLKQLKIYLIEVKIASIAVKIQFKLFIRYLIAQLSMETSIRYLYRNKLIFPCNLNL